MIYALSLATVHPHPTYQGARNATDPHENPASLRTLAKKRAHLSPNKIPSDARASPHAKSRRAGIDAKRGSARAGGGAGCLRCWLGARMLVASAASSSAQAQKRRPGPVTAAIHCTLTLAADPVLSLLERATPSSRVRYGMVAMATSVCSIFASRTQQPAARTSWAPMTTRKPPS
jgi:hypothetical protein